MIAKPTMTSPVEIKTIAIVLAIIAATCWATTGILRKIAERRIATAKQSVHLLAMGTVASATFHGDADIEKAAGIVRQAFSDVETNLSIFAEESIVGRLNRQGMVAFSKEELRDPGSGASIFMAVLRLALHVAEESCGAFDPTVNPLMELWGQRGKPAVAVPDAAATEEALKRTGWKKIFVERHQQGGVGVCFSASGMQLDFGGIAKGFAVDLACERLASAGFDDFMVNLGGNIRVWGKPGKGRKTWRVAIRDPEHPDRTTGETIELESGQAVATSGSYERYVEIGGRRYSHIIDPRTGRPVEKGGSVTVVSGSAAKADAWSTAFFVQGKRGVEKKIGASAKKLLKQSALFVIIRAFSVLGFSFAVHQKKPYWKRRDGRAKEDCALLRDAIFRYEHISARCTARHKNKDSIRHGHLCRQLGV